MSLLYYFYLFLCHILHRCIENTSLWFSWLLLVLFSDFYLMMFLFFQLIQFLVMLYKNAVLLLPLPLQCYNMVLGLLSVVTYIGSYFKQKKHCTEALWDLTDLDRGVLHRGSFRLKFKKKST